MMRASKVKNKVESFSMSVKERMIYFCETMNIPKSSFYSKLGITASTFAWKNISGDIMSSTLQNMAKHYPNANMYWILIGEGQMERIDESADIRQMLKDKEQIISQLEELLELERARTEDLKDLVRLYREKEKRTP